MENPESYEQASCYNSFREYFVEIDAQCEERTINDQFDKLLSRVSDEGGAISSGLFQHKGRNDSDWPCR